MTLASILQWNQVTYSQLYQSFSKLFKAQNLGVIFDFFNPSLPIFSVFLYYSVYLLSTAMYQISLRHGGLRQ